MLGAFFNYSTRVSVFVMRLLYVPQWLSTIPYLTCARRIVVNYFFSFRKFGNEHTRWLSSVQIELVFFCRKTCK